MCPGAATGIRRQHVHNRTPLREPHLLEVKQRRVVAARQHDQVVQNAGLLVERLGGVELQQRVQREAGRLALCQGKKGRDGAQSVSCFWGQLLADTCRRTDRFISAASTPAWAAVLHHDDASTADGLTRTSWATTRVALGIPYRCIEQRKSPHERRRVFDTLRRRHSAK